MSESIGKPRNFPGDFIAGVVVFLVAVPLCLGVALASGAPLFSGLIAGMVGGILVGILSGSHSSVSGPAAGLTAVVAAQIQHLGSFEAFTLALFIGGLIQLVLGLIKAGGISAFVPSSVITGLLSAIGLILILKQIPHLFGHDTDPEGEMSYFQPDRETTFSEFGKILGDLHPGAALIGMASVALLYCWDRNAKLKKSIFPAPLFVVILGIVAARCLSFLGPNFVIGPSHLVQVPVARDVRDFLGYFVQPDFSRIFEPAIYLGALTIAIVASLETLLNLEAVDKLDPLKRKSPPNRELIAQGIGNVVCGLIGGIPVTSVIVRSSVNLNAGARSRISTIFHGSLILASVFALPGLLNSIPLSALAAILLMTGLKLASPKIIAKMWREGRRHFLPYIATVLAIVFTDLLIGILIGMCISLGFILHENLRRPLNLIREKHLGGEVLHLRLSEQVSFLNKASIEKLLNDLEPGTTLLIDANGCEYIDPDILMLIRDFDSESAAVHGIKLSLDGFKDKYLIENRIQFVDYSTQELQSSMTPDQVLAVLLDGNERFRNGHRLTRDLNRQVVATALGQHPLAVVLSCIDSRSPAELLFDLGLGDIFSIRVAGNVVGPKVLASMEYGTAVAGAKLILVLGHTRCGAVTAAVQFHDAKRPVSEISGCQHLEHILKRIDESIDDTEKSHGLSAHDSNESHIDDVIRRNVTHSVRNILEASETIRKLVADRQIAVAGAVYDVSSGEVEIIPESVAGLDLPSAGLKASSNSGQIPAGG